MEAKKCSATELEIQNDPKWKKFQEENEEMKKTLSIAEDQYSSSRRTLRSAIPSDKALASMSSETLRELSRRLKKHLSDKNCSTGSFFSRIARGLNHSPGSFFSCTARELSRCRRYKEMTAPSLPMISRSYFDWMVSCAHHLELHMGPSLGCCCATRAQVWLNIMLSAHLRVKEVGRRERRQKWYFQDCLASGASLEQSPEAHRTSRLETPCQ